MDAVPRTNVMTHNKWLEAGFKVNLDLTFASRGRG
jgi:hypothetical protein